MKLITIKCKCGSLIDFASLHMALTSTIWQKRIFQAMTNGHDINLVPNQKLTIEFCKCKKNQKL
jgi:hypothetical protein